MEKGKYVGVWLYDKATRLFLNLPRRSAKQRESRWLVLGLVEDEASIGLWLAIDKIEERTPEGLSISKTWTVTPRICLIRWDFIIHAQLLGTIDDAKTIGFRPTNP